MTDAVGSVRGVAEGIVRVHRKRCPGGRCRCSSYEAWVRDARAGRKIRRTFPSEQAARNWRTDTLSKGKRVPRSASTVRDVLMPLRVIFKRALRDGETATNPLLGVELPAGDERPRDRVLTPEETTAFLGAWFPLTGQRGRSRSTAVSASANSRRWNGKRSISTPASSTSAARGARGRSSSRRRRRRRRSERSLSSASSAASCLSIAASPAGVAAW